jgi:hypothetical protein
LPKRATSACAAGYARLMAAFSRRELG